MNDDEYCAKCGVAEYDKKGTTKQQFVNNIDSQLVNTKSRSIFVSRINLQ